MKMSEIIIIERELKKAIVARNKKNIAKTTLLEAIDESSTWAKSFKELVPFSPMLNLDDLLLRTPLFVCAVATEIGFRFEGVGTEYWAKFEEALGLPISMAHRAQIGDAFAELAAKYKLSCPPDSAFTSHFSIISWPISNALLPVDLVGPIGRLVARAPKDALPRLGRSANFSSLRAWASAAEGARLVDWLRLEAPSERVLVSLLTKNRTGTLSMASYERLDKVIANSADAFFSVRTGRERVRIGKIPVSTEHSYGRLTLANDAAGLKLFATWNPLPSMLLDEARRAARSAAWRPRLWGAGAFIHPVTALGHGPFQLMHDVIPATDEPAYSDAVDVFGAGSDIAAVLAARRIDWTTNLLFDVNADRTLGEQRNGVFASDSEIGWVAIRDGGSAIEHLRPIGSVCGYSVFEANLRDEKDQVILMAEGLLSKGARSSIARHPVDAITAPQGIVRPGRPFLLFNLGPPLSAEPLQALNTDERLSSVSGAAGHPGLRCDVALPSETTTLELSLFERESAFEALMERRLQIRVESPIALRDLKVSAELEIGDRLVVRSFTRVSELPATINEQSPLLQALYADTTRSQLFEAGSGVLRFKIGHLIKTEVPLERAQGIVDWSGDAPELIGSEFASELVSASTPTPHRFDLANAVALPNRGATAYGLRLTDGRIADPVKAFASSSFNLGDLAVNFTGDIGSRLMCDNGRGVGEIARARIAWSRALCTSLQAIAAKIRIVRQFEEPLVYDLCGKEWCATEDADRSKLSDPREVLYLVALERGLAELPEQATHIHIQHFARTFAHHARQFDPNWPLHNPAPAGDMMDEALNQGFSEAVRALQADGQLLNVDPDDCDFGRPDDEWERVAAEAINRTRRPELVQLIAPSAGAKQLRDRHYANVGIAEMAEDLAAWTHEFALPRGRVSPECAAGALQLWLSPAGCDNVDTVVHVLANDPFVARATRYAAIRMRATFGKAIP